MIFSTSNFLSSTKLFLSAHLSNQDLRKLHASKHLLVDYRLFAQSSWLGDTYKNMFLAIIVPNAISSFTVRFYYQTMKNKCLEVQRLTGHLGVKHCFKMKNKCLNVQRLTGHLRVKHCFNTAARAVPNRE